MRVVVIGGGPAGMMAAYSAAESGADTVLLEKNEKLGKKLYLTGKGRCNLTNACETEEFFFHVVRNPKFLYSAIYTFPSDMLLDTLRSVNLKTKVERGGRIFPETEKSSDVIRALERLMRQSGVHVRLCTQVEALVIEKDQVAGVRIKGQTIAADAVIIATGGVSYPRTGSTGDGYRLAADAGHSSVRPVPSLIPFEIKEQALCQRLQGLTLKNVGFTLTQGNRKSFQGQGEMLFTHFGISGPLVLMASAHIRVPYVDAEVHIDLKPGLRQEQLDVRVRRDLEKFQKKQLKNALFELYPRALVPEILSKAQVNPEKMAVEMTREERTRLVEITKDFSLTVSGVRPIEEAIITRGGIPVKEIDASTMQSRRTKGLYFAGEIIDVDAYTGGYNLQIAFSTGYLAGMSAAKTESFPGKACP